MELKNLEFKLKEKGAQKFFEENLCKNSNINFDINHYHLFQDELFLKKNWATAIANGDICVFTKEYSDYDFFCFELSDSSLKSKKSLVNHYKYRIDYYDDVMIKLVLVDFKITINNDIIK